MAYKYMYIHHFFGTAGPRRRDAGPLCFLQQAAICIYMYIEREREIEYYV